MFTGIIEAIGTINEIQLLEGDLRIGLVADKLDLTDTKVGDSIAINGVCLTVIKLLSQKFWADISAETLLCTTLGKLVIGQRVNLEKAITPTTRLGGHLVSGHVDGIGLVIESKPISRSIFYKIRAPKDLAKYIAAKGSITVDGTSLTVNAVNNTDFELNIIPQTLLETIFSEYKVGQQVNLEIDLLARYLERLLMMSERKNSKVTSNITESFLIEHGFIR